MKQQPKDEKKSAIKELIQSTAQNKGDFLLGITILQLFIILLFSGLAYFTFVYMRFEDPLISYILSFGLVFLGIIAVVFEMDRKLLLYWQYKANQEETVRWLKVLASRLYELSKKRDIEHILQRFPESHVKIMRAEMALLAEKEKKPIADGLPSMRMSKESLNLDVGKADIKAKLPEKSFESTKMTMMQMLSSSYRGEKPGVRISSTNADARRMIKDISLNYDTHLAVKDFLSDAEMAIVNRVSHAVLLMKHGFKIFVMAEFEKNIEEIRKVLGVVDRNFYAWVIICQHEQEIQYYVPVLTDKGNIILFEKFAEWADPKIK